MHGGAGAAGAGWGREEVSAMRIRQVNRGGIQYRYETFKYRFLPFCMAISLCATSAKSDTFVAETGGCDRFSGMTEEWQWLPPSPPYESL